MVLIIRVKMKIKYKQIQQICIWYIVAWMIAPPLAYDMIYRIMAISAALLWTLIQIFSPKIDKYNSVMKQALSKYLICAITYGAALIFFDCVFKKYSIFSAFYNNITTYIFLFVGYIGGTYCKEERLEEIKKTFYFLLGLIVVFSITSLMRSEEFYLMTRSAGGEVDEAYNALARRAAMRGVGAFGFFALSAAFSPLVLWISYAYEGVRKLTLLLAFVIIEFGVISAGYTLALLISFFGICYTFIFKIKSKVIRVLFIFGATILLIFGNEILIGIYHFLQSIANGTMYANKVEDIFSFLLSGDSTGTFDSRLDRYLFSFTSIFKYPVFGSYILNGTNSIGSHSAILDPFAAYGWLIGAVWVYVLIAFPRKMSTIISDKKLSTLITLVLFFTALFNRTPMMMGMFFFIAPALGYIEKKNMETTGEIT